MNKIQTFVFIWRKKYFKKRINEVKATYILRMKRKILLAILAVVIIVASLSALVACNKKGEEKPAEPISRITREYYAGESDLFAVVVEKGEREKNFIADGKATDVCAFATVSVTPLKTNDYEELAYELKGETSTLTGSIARDEYGEYKTDVTLDFVPKQAIITVGETKSEIDLVSVLEGALSVGDIINIAKAEFKDTLDKEAELGKEREIYLKVITGDRENYFYYVSFIGDGVDYLAVLIEPKTGKVVSKK